MKAVDIALYDLLSADAQLQTLAPGGVYRNTGDQDAVTPFVSFNQQDGQRRYTLGTGIWRPLTYQIKAIDQSDDADAAYQVQARISALLQGAVLVLDGGHRTLICSQTSDIEYEEPGEPPWQHVGGLWEITVQ